MNLSPDFLKSVFELGFDRNINVYDANEQNIPNDKITVRLLKLMNVVNRRNCVLYKPVNIDTFIVSDDANIDILPKLYLKRLITVPNILIDGVSKRFGMKDWHFVTTDVRFIVGISKDFDYSFNISTIRNSDNIIIGMVSKC